MSSVRIVQLDLTLLFFAGTRNNQADWILNWLDPKQIANIKGL